VAWGYYWSKAKPVLTVHSGDTVRIQTLSTCGSNERMESEGVPASAIQAYNQPIYDQVKDKGPGGHILTGPVAIAEAEPGDVLEVDILKIDLDAPFACNGFGAAAYANAENMFCAQRKQTSAAAPGRAASASHLKSTQFPKGEAPWIIVYAAAKSAKIKLRPILKSRQPRFPAVPGLSPPSAP
jgi:acetamidase/formamidase